MAWHDDIDLGQWTDKADPNATWCVEAAAAVIEDVCNRTFGVDDEPVPAAIRLATAMLAARLLARRHTPEGPLNSQQVDDVRLGYSGGTGLDDDVARLIKPYILTWWVA